MGIEKELFIFLLAVLAGIIVRLAYCCLGCLRKVVRHTHWAIELEDLVYWMGTAVFLFVQIYNTSSGSVRWYFILGVAFGVLGLSFVLKKLGEWSQKIIHRQRCFFFETLEKGRKKR